MTDSKLPGTTIDTPLYIGAANNILTPMFFSGGLVLSQVSQLTGLEGYIIQNWVKRKFLPPPEGKKYDRSKLCRILNINVLKDSFTLEQVAALIGHVNGMLADDADNLIDDSQLYSYFVDCLAATGAPNRVDLSHVDEVIRDITVHYQGPHTYAKERLHRVLTIMVVSYEALQIKQQALTLFYNLDYQ